MESTRKPTCGMFCHALPSIPSIASKNCCPGMSRPQSINIHPPQPEASRLTCADGLRLTHTDPANNGAQGRNCCPGCESNPHAEKSPEDFKSSASAIQPPGQPAENKGLGN